MSDDENKVVNIFTKQAEQGGVTFGHIEPATVLNAAIEANVKEVLVLGWDEDGAFYIASSEGYTPDLITLCEIGKSTLLSGYEA
jgi:hypothetical protein